MSADYKTKNKYFIAIICLEIFRLYSFRLLTRKKYVQYFDYRVIEPSNKGHLRHKIPV